MDEGVDEKIKDLAEQFDDLSERTALYRWLFYSIPVPVIGLRRDEDQGSYKVVDCNEEAAQILGYGHAEMRGLDFASWIDAENLDDIESYVAEAIERGSAMEPKELDIELLRRDGTRMPVEVRMSQPFRMEDRVYMAVILVLRPSDQAVR